MTLRTIVVDDSIIFRKVVRDALAGIEGVQVIDVAKDGSTAIEKICRLRPDLVTLDIEMPELNGLQVLEELQRRGVQTRVIMVSSLTSRGAEVTTQALAKGAFDFILKPDSTGVVAGVETLRTELRLRIQAIATQERRTDTPTDQRSVVREFRHDAVTDNNYVVEVEPASKPRHQIHSTIGHRGIPEVILLGISTGGPNALASVLPQLPADFAIPIVIVQHMPPMFTATMARHLDNQCALHVEEAQDSTPIVRGGIYIAPGGKQLSVRSNGSGGLETVVDDSPAVKSCKPSVDHLMFSVPASVAARSLAIIMTGMGSDGRDGCERLKHNGATIWAQSAESCTVYGMPRQVIDSGLADATFDLNELAGLLQRLTAGRGPTYMLPSASNATAMMPNVYA
jgi:two-component system chemotaxis response regulator CheB